MRIIAGRFKGTRLSVPRGTDIRPSGGRLREALFSILGPTPRGATLDLYAGTGALGLEVLSRGGGPVTFVERAARVADALEETLSSLGLGPDEARVVREEAIRTLRRLAAAGRRFELVLADPPYDGRGARAVVRAVAEAGLLEPEGLLVVESAARGGPLEVPVGLTRIRQETYGDSSLTFLRRAEPPRA